MHPYLSDAPDAVVIATAAKVTRIALAEGETEAVRQAVEALRTDLSKVCGAQSRLQTDASGATIVVGTLGSSALIDRAVADGRLDITGLLEDDGRPRWEAFLIRLVDDVLYLVGSDRRGTVYGIYDLCEAMGVSPWWWFADVPVRPRVQVAVRPDASHCDWPSVKYRGIFINDEEELDNWARQHTGDGTIGPELYRRIFELVLRLKGNYVWPAMHVNAFNADPESGRVAHQLGIVIGTSHCDMLLRSNQHEFEPWAAAQPEPVVYDYSIPGRNRELIGEYWRGSVQQNGGYEVSWTLGMRGIHDSGFITSQIDADPTLSAADRQQARVRLLEQIIDDQRALLRTELGPQADEALQVFVPYKEVLDLYDAGLKLPEDITIIWSNDSFGYIRRVPAAADLARPGGHGLYYHSSYWSPPPRSYLATSSTPLALMQHQLRRAWARGIRTLWVDNIGGLKPLEVEMECFLRLAWQAGRESTTADAVGFVAQWADRTFSGDHGQAIGELYARYYQLNNQRKIEHLAARAFSQTGYGDESARRLAQWRDLYDQTTAIWAGLPDDQRDSFFQLVAVKIHLAYLVNAEFGYADRSALAYRQGRPAAADRYLALSRRFTAHKRALLHSYNHVMADAKWQHMLTPEQTPPPAMALYPAGMPALQIGEPGLGVAVWGDPAGRQLTFSPYGARSKWIDVFTTGVPGASFTAQADNWIALSATQGELDPDRRITVSIPDATGLAGRQGSVVISAGGESITVVVQVTDAPELPTGFVGSIEADGHLSLDPSRPDHHQPAGDSRWEPVPWLGHDENDVMEARGGPGATLEFRILLVTGGAHLLEVHRLPTLDAPGELRITVAVDEQPPITLSFPTTDEHRGTWEQAVLDNVERLQITLPHLDPGAHLLRVSAVDDGVALSKLILHTAHPEVTNLGPRLSFHTSRPRTLTPDPDPGEVDLAALDSVARDLYRVDPAAVELPPTLYAGREYWQGEPDPLARRVLRVPQHGRGRRRYAARADGTTDVVAEFGTGRLSEVNGRLAIEAEYALAGDRYGWTTPAADLPALGWTHTQAETDGGSGLAMHVDAPGRHWDDPATAPALHYAIEVTHPGRYHAWLLIKCDHQNDDACWLAVDGQVTDCAALFGWDTTQLWHWTTVTDLELSAGAHTLSIHAAKAGLRIDRIYLTLGDELPPDDAAWQASPRSEPEPG